jgi:hypothetical protein
MADLKSIKSLMLVIGAGASNEAHLPTGAELKQNIAAALNLRFKGPEMESGDDVIAQALNILTRSQGRPQDLSAYIQTSRLIAGAMPQAQSIDNFIDSHKKDARIAQCGKLAITRCILSAEAASLMMVDRSNIYNKIDFRSLEATWFNAFFQLIVENRGHEELPERLAKLAVISFNYDRCIEHFLHSSFQNYYGISPEQATALMSNLEIYHPYGTVGALPWMNQTQRIDYGDTPHSQQLLELSQNIRTFTEGTDVKSSNIVAIRNLVQTAKRVVFLGFAFHQLNLELLYERLSVPHAARACPVYATAVGLSESDSSIIRNDLHTVGGHELNQIYLRHDLKSNALFREYWRSFSLG